MMVVVGFGVKVHVSCILSEQLDEFQRELVDHQLL